MQGEDGDVDMKTEIITIGAEVLRQETREDNADFISRRLVKAGLAPHRITVLPDDREEISRELKAALSRSTLVVVTGGLGPTEDDVTRKGAIEALGGAVETREDIVETIRARFDDMGIEMPAGYLDLANIPAGASVLPNPVGAAPGLRIERDGCLIFLLPGVPAEMRAIFDSSLQNVIDEGGGASPEVIRIYGMMETSVEDIAREVLGDELTADLSIICGPAGINLYIDPREVSENDIKKLRERFGNYIYTNHDRSLEEEVLDLLRSKGSTLSVAESLTGGMLASIIVSVPGASDAFMEAFITYSNAAKTGRLGVDAEMIAEYGAVSAQVCRAMASGAREKSRTDLAISTTGIAGPGGGSEEKPVGLCYTGLATPDGIYCCKRQFPGDRMMIRTRAVYTALDMLRLFLAGELDRLERYRQVEGNQAG